jgi:hypothetical protein
MYLLADAHVGRADQEAVTADLLDRLAHLLRHLVGRADQLD